MRTTHREVLLWLTLIGLPVLDVVAAAQVTQSNEDCLACHEDPAAIDGAGQSLALTEDAFESTLHGQMGLTCVDCHADLATTDVPHPDALEPAARDACHEDQTAAYEQGIHAVARQEGPASEAATCRDCHGSHTILPASDPDSLTYALNLPSTCGRCHGDAEVIERGRIEIGDVYAVYLDSIHGRAVSRSQLLVAANCSHCHGSHAIRTRSDPESSVNHARVPETCGTCHAGIERSYNLGVHGDGIRNGEDAAPVCHDCHTPHEIQRADVEAWQLDVIRECGTCHVDKIETYRDTFHGQVTELGFVRVAACADCHGAHEIYPTEDARSMVSSERVLETCQRCHPAATAGFALYDPHADKDDVQRNPVLYYVARFMRWLIIGVFGFFGLHLLLWLPRGLQVRRQRIHGERYAGEQG